MGGGEARCVGGAPWRGEAVGRAGARGAHAQCPSVCMRCPLWESAIKCGAGERVPSAASRSDDTHSRLLRRVVMWDIVGGQVGCLIFHPFRKYPRCILAAVRSRGLRAAQWRTARRDSPKPVQVCPCWQRSRGLDRCSAPQGLRPSAACVWSQRVCLEPVNVFGASECVWSRCKGDGEEACFPVALRNHCIQNVVGAPLVTLGRGARPALPAATPGTDGNG